MSNNVNPPGSTPLPYYVASYQGRTVAIKRDPDYQATIKLVQKSIAKLRSVDSQDIIISTTLADYGNAVVQISEEIWPDVVGGVKIVEIAVEPSTPLESPAPSQVETRTISFTPRDAEPVTAITAAPTLDESESIASLEYIKPSDSSAGLGETANVTLRVASQDLVNLDGLSPSANFRDVKNLIEQKYGIPVALQVLETSGSRHADSLKLEQSDARNGVPLDLVLQTRKSIFYILPSYTYQNRSNTSYGHFGSYETCYRLNHLRNVTLQVSVNRKWDLAALGHYGCNSSADLTQSTSWIIDVSTENTLSDPSTKLIFPWIYWDGSSSACVMSSVPDKAEEKTMQEDCTTEFYESMQTMTPNNSVAVPVKEIEGYISGVLKSSVMSRSNILRPLLLHINLQPCSHVAIRFLPQAEYRKAAAISILECPDANVHHLVLLYKRLDAKAASIWDYIPPFYGDQVATWESIINLPAEVNRSQVAVVDFTFLEIH
ncbi:polyubiquitin-C [Ceratobasidium sp. AG-Ba]|nr:polyubiquitin-C [Ceratobasidium sp. AG-Ba]